MAKIKVEWEETEEVTLHNIRRRLYFDPDRTRLVEDDRWYDMSHLRDKQLAIMWCKVNEVEFFDHTITRYPKFIRRFLLKVRAAGFIEERHAQPKWVSVPWGKEMVKMPVLTPRPSESERDETPRPKRSKVMESDDGGKTWKPI